MVGSDFFGVNSIYIPLLEEPLLGARFGGAYAQYARHVPRLIPRAPTPGPHPSGTDQDGDVTRDNG